ncbi:MAG: hypothetical protein QOJ40_3084 [Verrucomicrobiota bacterium]
MNSFLKFQFSKFSSLLRSRTMGFGLRTSTVRCSMFDVRCSMFSSPILPLLLGLWTLDSGLWTLAAQPTNSTDRFDFSAFKLITDRNIFNSHRSSGYKPRTESGPQSRVDSFALVGTMSYEKGPFAFFDGTSSEYRKAVKREDGIAGFKVADIEPAFVKLASPSNEIELAVGMEMRREDKGEWHLAARAESPVAGPDRSTVTRPALPTRAASPAAAPAAAGSGAPIVVVDPETQLIIGEPLTDTAGTNAAPATATGGSEADILERLRIRREQEQSNP